MIPKLSIVLGILSFMYGGFSYYHFWIKYPDPSQWIFSMFIAIILMSWAFMWSWKKDMQDNYRELEESFGRQNAFMEKKFEEMTYSHTLKGRVS